VTARE